jgi:hypothetical protein
VADITDISELCQIRVMYIWEVKAVEVFHFPLNKVTRDVNISFQYALISFQEDSLLKTYKATSKRTKLAEYL